MRRKLDIPTVLGLRCKLGPERGQARGESLGMKDWLFESKEYRTYVGTCMRRFIDCALVTVR